VSASSPLDAAELLSDAVGTARASASTTLDPGLGGGTITTLPCGGKRSKIKDFT